MTLDELPAISESSFVESTPLINLSRPESSSVHFPPGWCEANSPGGCICGQGLDVINFVNDSDLMTNVSILPLSLAATVDFWTEGVILPIICTIGILGNIVSISVLTNKDIDLKPSFVNILICLAFYDLLFEVFAIMMYCLPNISVVYKETIFPLFLPYLLYLIHIALTGSIYTTIAVASERCCTVLAPFSQIKSVNGLMYVCPIIIFSFLYNIPKFFEVKTRCLVTLSTENGSDSASWVSDKYIWEKSEMRSEKYYMIYITANCILMGLLPMVVLSILNWLIFRAITRARALHNTLKSGNSHRRDNTMATVLTAIVFVFVICHFPKAALNIYEVGTIQEEDDRRKSYLQELFPSLLPFKEDPLVNQVLDIVANMSHLLIVTNSAINIVVYALKVLWSFFCGKQPHFKTSGYQHPSKKFSSARTWRGEEAGPSTNIAISTNLIDISVDQSLVLDNNMLTTDF